MISSSTSLTSSSSGGAEDPELELDEDEGVGCFFFSFFLLVPFDLALGSTGSSVSESSELSPAARLSLSSLGARNIGIFFFGGRPFDEIARMLIRCFALAELIARGDDSAGRVATTLTGSGEGEGLATTRFACFSFDLFFLSERRRRLFSSSRLSLNWLDFLPLPVGADSVEVPGRSGKSSSDEESIAVCEVAGRFLTGSELSLSTRSIVCDELAFLGGGLRGPGFFCFVTRLLREEGLSSLS